MRIYKFLIYVPVFIYLSGCKEDIITKPDKVDFFPLNIGNYWVFNTYEINSSHQKINGTENRDSLVIENYAEIEGKSAFILSVYRNGKIFDTLYLSSTQQNIFILFDNSFIDIANFEGQWFLIADFTKLNSSEWHIYDTIQTDFPFNFEGSTLYTTYHHTLNGNMEYTGDYQLNNSNLKSIVFQTRYDTKLYFNYKFQDSQDEVEVNRIKKRKIHFTFVENIGLAGIKYDPFEIITKTNPATDYSKTEYHNGLQSDLINYRLLIEEPQKKD